MGLQPCLVVVKDVWNLGGVTTTDVIPVSGLSGMEKSLAYQILNLGPIKNILKPKDYRKFVSVYLWQWLYCLAILNPTCVNAHCSYLLLM